jgi:hypothetical protein
MPCWVSFVASAGFDNNRTVVDYGLVRRLVARQMAFGCHSVNNCTVRRLLPRVCRRCSEFWQ